MLCLRLSEIQSGPRNCLESSDLPFRRGPREDVTGMKPRSKKTGKVKKPAATLKAVAERAKLDRDDFWLHRFRATFATRCSGRELICASTMTILE